MSGGILEGNRRYARAVEGACRLAAARCLAQVVGTIAAPLRNFVGVLNAVPRNLVNVLDQIRKQKETNGEAAA